MEKLEIHVEQLQAFAVAGHGDNALLVCADENEDHHWHQYFTQGTGLDEVVIAALSHHDKAHGFTS